MGYINQPTWMPAANIPSPLKWKFEVLPPVYKMQVWKVLHAARWKYRTQKVVGKKRVKQQYLLSNISKVLADSPLYLNFFPTEM